MANKIDSDIIKEIHRLRDDGVSKNKVKQMFGVTWNTVERHWWNDDDEPCGYLRWCEWFAKEWGRETEKLRRLNLAEAIEDGR